MNEGKGVCLGATFMNDRFYQVLERVIKLEILSITMLSAQKKALIAMLDTISTPYHDIPQNAKLQTLE